MRQIIMKALKFAVTLAGIAGISGVPGLSVPAAHAAFALKDALITIGIGAATGTILGASTLPFYGNAGDHVENVFMGAGAGAAAGLGLALYLLATPEDTRDGSSGSFPTGSNPMSSPNITRIDSQVYNDFSGKDYGFESLSHKRRRSRDVLSAANVFQFSNARKFQLASHSASVPSQAFMGPGWKLAVHFFRVSF